MIKYYKLFVLFSVSLIFILIMTSCDDSNDVDTSTHKYTRKEISQQPGFLWVDAKADTYEPNKDTVNILKEAFNQNTGKIKFVFFVKPACSCDAKQYPFPYSLKILDLMSLSDTNHTEIYSVYSTSSDNPYKNSGLILKDLPEIFIFKNNVPIYSVIDSLNLYGASSSFNLETAILEGLKK